MENRSTKLPLAKGKNQPGCIWGLVNMFDFRNGRINQKVLSNGTTMHKHGFDIEQSRKVYTVADFCEKYQGLEDVAGLGIHDVDACKTKIKDIMQEEFPTEKQLKKLLKAMKQQRKRSDSMSIHQLANDQKKASKAIAPQKPMDQRKEKIRLGHHQCSSSDELPLDSHIFAAILEEISSQIHQDIRCNGDMQRCISPSRFKQLDEINMQLLQMSAKAFIDQIYINRRYMRKDAGSSKSKSFSDASEILHLNRDLFLTLLQDPNSLLVKHIQQLQFPPREKERIKLLLDINSLECHSSGIRDHGDTECTTRLQKSNMNNLLWKKLKHRYGFPSKRSTSSTSNEIVVLKPASKIKKNPENVSCYCSSLQSHQSLKSKGRNSKATYFSFKEIKRKFKAAVGESGKEKHWISLDDRLNKLARNKHSLKYLDKGISPSISTGESTLCIDADRRVKQQKPIGLRSRNGPKIDFNSVAESKKFNSSTTSCSRQRQLDIFTEAKRHLSERFSYVNVAETLPRKQAPRTLQTILSSPDHDFLVTLSPKRDVSASVSTQRKFSCHSNIQKGKGSSPPSPKKQNEEVPPSADSRSDDQLEIIEFRPSVPENNDADTEVQESTCSLGDDLKTSGHADIPEENESMLPGNFNILEESWEQNRVDGTCCGPSNETTRLSEDNGNVECSNLANSLEDHHQRSLLGSPSSPLNIRAQDIMDSAKDREGHPSPVSVLEPFSPEDVNSPTSITPEPAESPLRPRHIDFDNLSQAESPEDPSINFTACTDEEDYVSAYIRAVMQASGLNFEELSTNPLPHVLNMYSVDSVGLFQVESNCDLNLLLDCIHEVLLGVYRCHFGYSPSLSFLKPNIRSVLLEANVVDEVANEVNSYLSTKLGQPSLDQLVGKDIAKSSSWLELRADTEDIVIQIAEDVLQDSMVDTILELQS